jgi:hypothetical protein
VLGITSVTLFVVGWAWDHQDVALLFATAPIVAVAAPARGPRQMSDQPFRRWSVWSLTAGATRLRLRPVRLRRRWQLATTSGDISEL